MSAIDPNAIIAAIPPTLAAFVAWRALDRKLHTNHGRKPGQYIEDTHKEVVESRKDLRDHIAKDERVWEYLNVPEHVLEGDTSASS